MAFIDDMPLDLATSFVTEKTLLMGAFQFDRELHDRGLNSAPCLAANPLRSQ
jgi:hypothetical protein